MGFVSISLLFIPSYIHMKHKLLLVVCSLSLLVVGGCSFDESLETSQQHDGDDINVIQDVWPQALDKVLYGYASPVVVAQSFEQLSPSPVIVSIPSPSSKQSVQPSVTPIVAPQPLPQQSNQTIQTPAPAGEDISSKEEDDNWERD